MGTLVSRKSSILSGGQTPDQGQNDFIIYGMPQKLAQILQEMGKKLGKRPMAILGTKSTWGDLTKLVQNWVVLMPAVRGAGTLVGWGQGPNRSWPGGRTV